MTTVFNENNIQIGTQYPGTYTVTYVEFCGSNPVTLFNGDLPGDTYITVDNRGDGYYTVSYTIDGNTNDYTFIRIDDLIRAIGGLYQKMCNNCGNCNSPVNVDLKLLEILIWRIKTLLGLCYKSVLENCNFISNIDCTIDKLLNAGEYDKSDKEYEQKIFSEFQYIYSALLELYSNKELLDNLIKYEYIVDCLERIDGYNSVIGAVNIKITGNNSPSNIPDINISIESGGSYTFQLQDFTTGFVDPEGDSFDGIKILSSPTRGRFILNGVQQVLYPFTVTAQDIANGSLVFEDDPSATTDLQFSVVYLAKDNGSQTYSS